MKILKIHDLLINPEDTLKEGISKIESGQCKIALVVNSIASLNCFKEASLFFISVMLDKIEKTPPSGNLVEVDCQIEPS